MIVDKHAKRSAFLQSMHKNDDFKAILAVAETLEPWLVSVALRKKGQEILKELESLSNAQQREISELQTFEYHGADYGRAIEFACQKCKETSRSKQVQQPHTNCGDSFFDFRPASETNDLLNELKVDGRSPSSNGEWSRVQRGLEYQQSRVAWNETGFQLLCNSGCPTEQIYSNDGTCTFHVDLPKKLQRAEELEELLNKLPRETYEQLYQYVTSSDFKTTQDEFRKLTTDIQELESELVFVQAIVKLNQELTPDHRSQFVQLSQKVKKFSNNALSSGGAPSTKVGVRLDEELKESFNSVAKFWPFVVMTESQVGRYVFEDHCFDLAVLDEASQSNCNAISILSRCKQLLVVGDDKQVSPSTIGTSEERIRELKRALPNIPSANNLLPESSFFDFLKTAFPTSSVILREHFRSDPRIISISNDGYYNKQMTPLKLPSKAVAVEHVALKGTMDAKKVNKVEAVHIVDQVLCQIKRTKENGSVAVDTIGVISLGGSNQSKYIEGLYKEKVDSIRTLYGSEIVDKHKVRFGVPSELQGDERDQIFLSGVYSADKTISLQARPSDWKQLNVALTRAKKKLVLVCSYESRHLKPMDVRRPVLEKFHDATASTGFEMSTKTPAFDARSEVEGRLVSKLRSSGLKVIRNGEKIWSSALLITSSDMSNSAVALVNLENAGESTTIQQKILDEQQSLERAGRGCLRVDYLSLVFDFNATWTHICDFLHETLVFTEATVPHDTAKEQDVLPQDSPQFSTTASSVEVEKSVAGANDLLSTVSDVSEPSKAGSPFLDGKQPAVVSPRPATTSTASRPFVSAASVAPSSLLTARNRKEYNELKTRRDASTNLISGKIDFSGIKSPDLKTLIEWKTGKPCPKKNKRDRLDFWKQIFGDGEDDLQVLKLTPIEEARLRELEQAVKEQKESKKRKLTAAPSVSNNKKPMDDEWHP